MKYQSSNKNKIKEVKEFFGNSIEMIEGKDFPEILDNKENVIIYKTLLANSNIIIEDATISIEGREIVDIKWELENLAKTLKIDQKLKTEWTVILGIKKEKEIILIKRTIKGFFINPEKLPETDYFLFDPYFIPKNSDNQTLHELRLNKTKYKFNPRILAIKDLLFNKNQQIIKLKNIKLFDGKWQNNYTLKDYIKKYKIDEEELKFLSRYFKI